MKYLKTITEFEKSLNENNSGISKEEYKKLLDEYNKLTEEYQDLEDVNNPEDLDNLKAKEKLNKEIDELENKIHSYERDYKLKKVNI